MGNNKSGWLRWAALALALLLDAEDGVAAFYWCKGGARCPLGAVSVGSQPQEAAGGRHFLWKATRGGATLYLFGSVHVGVPEIYPLPDPILAAFRSADALVVEMNAAALSRAEMKALMAERARYRGGATLQDSLPPELWDSLEGALRSIGLPADQLRNARPWLVVTLLQMAVLGQAGFDPELGIDNFFLKSAGDRLPVLELESFSQQLALLDGLPLGQQVRMLEQTLKELSRGPEQLRALLKAWQEGDGDAMEKMLTRDFGTDEDSQALFRALFSGRNRAMADKLAALAKDGRTYFVVVGAGHLVGKEGLVALLSRRGFALTQQ